MGWQQILQALTKKVFTVVANCMRKYKTEAKNQLATIKESSPEAIYEDMGKKFRQYQWFVLDLPSSGLVANTKVDIIHSSKQKNLLLALLTLAFQINLDNIYFLPL